MGAPLLKMVLFVFNIVYVFLGATSLGLGIWVVISRSEVFRFINMIDQAQINSASNQHGLILAAGFVLIGIGSFTLLVGCCGCCGAIKDSEHLLVSYAVLVGLVLAVEVVAAIIAGVFQGQVRSTTEAGMLALQDKMFIGMPDYLSGMISEDNKTVTMLINSLQMAFECCGAKTVGDIANSSSWLGSNRTWEGRELQLPITCCKLRQDQKAAAASPSFDWAANLNRTLVDADCPFSFEGVNSETCFSSIADFANRFAIPIIVVASLIAAFELLGIFIACRLIRDIKSKRLVV